MARFSLRGRDLPAQLLREAHELASQLTHGHIVAARSRRTANADAARNGRRTTGRSQHRKRNLYTATHAAGQQQRRMTQGSPLTHLRLGWRRV